jgi:hypothetical protein
MKASHRISARVPCTIWIQGSNAVKQKAKNTFRMVGRLVILHYYKRNTFKNILQNKIATLRNKWRKFRCEITNSHGCHIGITDDVK